MAKHHPDLVLCRRTAGAGLGRLCARCEGKCPVCDSYVRPTAPVRVCDECNFGPAAEKCVICAAPGAAGAFYCKSCVRLEKDREGCPRVINLGAARVDRHYERKRYQFRVDETKQ